MTAYEKEKEESIRKFMAEPLVSFEGAVRLLGFDPMNLICAGNRCLHRHGMLRIGEKEHTLVTPFMEEYGDTIIDVKRIYLPDIAVRRDGCRIIVEGLGEMDGHMEIACYGTRCIVAE